MLLRMRARRPTAVLSGRLPALLLPLLLAACAPTQQKQEAPVTASTSVSRVSFYPSEAGLAWTYLPDGEDAGGVPYVLRATGPSLFGNVQAQTFTLTGRGAQQTSYHLMSAQGSQLLGFRKPGLSVRLDPPWQELPPVDAWRVGLAWSGESNIAVQSDDGLTNTSGKVNYSYRVLDQRDVTIRGRSYRVWVVNRQITDTVGGLFPRSQEEWFTPYVGDVRTPEGLLLTDRNFTGGQ
ncbi:hypothetical protein GCM10008939_05880 [Deinococcus aquiradiocola]|uniref:Lipoprotein n=2 Tax=Deinococcus aquiradiocola TaxID=393059 RepID=A0A917UL10_9DEIO|nr:hypothetical protein GCM10008939_05880 [Deinococcus aquiradiocola]